MKIKFMTKKYTVDSAISVPTSYSLWLLVFTETTNQRES